MNPIIIILIIIAILVLGLLAAGFIMGGVFYNISMNRYYQGKRISARAKNTSPGVPLVSKGRDHRHEWFDEVSLSHASIHSFDGLKLDALLVENAEYTDKFAIICHGYTGNAEEMGFEAEHFYDRGYSVLIPSARGHGSSEGDYIGFGWYERRDICGWIDWLNDKYSSPRVVLYGISMGGATVMMASGEELPANVICGIEDCGFSSIYDQFYHTLTSMVKINLPIILFFANIIIKKKTGIDIYRDGSSLKQLSSAHIPMLFMHGTADRYVPFSMLELNYSAHPGPKEKLVFEGVPHASCPWDGGAQYWDTVFGFIQKYL